MINTICILLSIALSSTLFGQEFNRYPNGDTSKIHALNRHRYEINSTAVKQDSLTLRQDSIDVSVRCYNNKIETSSIFRSSKSNLKVNFYFLDCTLIMIDVKEQSPFFKDLSAFSVFYFEHDTIFYSHQYFSIRMCMGIPANMSFYEIYGYNPALNAGFLREYSSLLLNRLKSTGISFFTLCYQTNIY